MDVCVAFTCDGGFRGGVFCDDCKTFTFGIKLQCSLSRGNQPANIIPLLFHRREESVRMLARNNGRCNESFSLRYCLASFVNFFGRLLGCQTRR